MMLTHRRLGEEEAAIAAARASIETANAAEVRAARAAVSAIGHAWLNVPAALPFVASCARLLTLQLVTLPLAAQLPELPDAISAARALKALDVSGNRIRTLPHSLTTLRELRDLNVSGNELDDLPSALSAMPNLHALSMQCNRFERCHRSSTVAASFARSSGARKGPGKGRRQWRRHRPVSRIRDQAARLRGRPLQHHARSA